MPQQPVKQFTDVEFRAKDIIADLKKEGYSGFQIQVIGTLLWDAGAFMAYDAARLVPAGPTPPLPPNLLKTVPANLSPPIKEHVNFPPSPAVLPPSQEKAKVDTGPVPKNPPMPEGCNQPAASSAVSEDGVYSCQLCMSPVGEQMKKASQLMFGKIYCSACCDKERVKFLKEKEAKKGKK